MRLPQCYSGTCYLLSLFWMSDSNGRHHNHKMPSCSPSPPYGCHPLVDALHVRIEANIQQADQLLMVILGRFS